MGYLFLLKVLIFFDHVTVRPSGVLLQGVKMLLILLSVVGILSLPVCAHIDFVGM